MTNNYDVIVAGLGAMGSATVAHLARRGHRVLGLDAHHRGHTLGSSHGTSRIIREAYYEHPAYVPLVQRAYTLWRELEAEAGGSLLTITGGLMLGPREGDFVDGAIRSAREHGLRCELLPEHVIESRFPGFRPPTGTVGVLEPNAGVLQPERCIAAQLDNAARHGATLHHREPVVGYRADGSGVTVGTVGARYRAERLVITTGPWAAELLADLAIPLTVRRVVNIHIKPARPELFARDRCPVFLWELPEGRFYGVPGTPDDPLKFGRHDAGEICTPHTIRRDVDQTEVDDLCAILEKYMPAALGQVDRALTCMYTLTPDEHFVLDVHPSHPQVVFGCGFSGHGFKFSSVAGEVLADLALRGSTTHDIRFLSLSRF